jgi:ferrous iron transport protein B
MTNSPNKFPSITLAELPNNDVAIITKILGHGSFRNRISEMGFIKGQQVKAIRNAPLKDPIEYEIMGYNISLRRSEAAQIEVVSPQFYNSTDAESYTTSVSDEDFLKTASEKSSNINIAMVGNPNCGKTTLYNAISGRHEKVGNYSGVTVDAMSSITKKHGYTFHIVDLPGTYSIAAFSPEEIYVRKHIMNNMPDIVVNVVDASNLERNLFLTTQLIDMNIKVVIALNMFDELEKTETQFDYISLGKMLGIPIIPTIASKGIGTDDLLKKIIECYEDNEPTLRHIHINYGTLIENAIYNVKQKIITNPQLTDKYCTRNLAIKLIENDNITHDLIKNTTNYNDIIDIANKESIKLKNEFNDNPVSIFSDAKYGFIAGALKETLIKGKNILELSSKIDAVLVNKFLGFPIFLLFM